MMLDTIAALSTPLGPGAIAVIRISGPRAEPILHQIFSPYRHRKEFESHRLYHGEIICPKMGTFIDEVLVCLMRGPHSYTGEDVVEVFCHGGIHLPQKVLSAVLSAGARLAERGEFTRRAFINGRLDLSQAEAVVDIINASSDRGRELALRQLKGELRDTIQGWRERLNHCLARLEASIDFTEEIKEGETIQGLAEDLETLQGEIQKLARTYERGRIFREGASIVILGRPNVGKSSLLNYLLGRRRAIVTPIPGTTRDFLEEMVDINGLMVRLIDTAGIHTTENVLEQAGIELVWDRLSDAELVIFLCDGSESLTEVDWQIMERIRARKVIPVINKIDLPLKINKDELIGFFGRPCVCISAKYGTGMGELKESIYRALTDQKGEGETGVAITHLRQFECLKRALAAISKGLSFDLVHQPECAAEELKDALFALGEITGDSVSEDLLDIIFSNFCVGK